MQIIPLAEILITLLSAIMAAAFGFKVREDTWFDMPNRKRRDCFKRDLVAAIQLGVGGWDEVNLLIQHSDLTRSEVREAMLSVFRDSVTGEKVDQKLKDEIKNLIKHADDNEPFADIPDTVAVRLDTLLTAAPEREADIRLLASSISDVVAHAAKDQKRQKILNYVGFAVGLLGLVVGIAGLIITARPNLLNSIAPLSEAKSVVQTLSDKDSVKESSSDAENKAK